MSVRIIPRVDIKGDHLVKGIHLEGLQVLGKPEEFARHYYEQGADELLYMDVVASLYGRNSLLEVIERTSREIFIPLTVGGGIRNIDDIRAVLRSGADKVSLNTAAIRRPALISEAVRAFGSSTIVVSVEAKAKTDGSYEAYVDNGRERTGWDAIEWAKRSVDLGAGEILLTSIDREGTGKGFDLELVRRLGKELSVPVIACGGAGSIDHIQEVVTEAGADGVCVASLLHYEVLSRLRSSPPQALSFSFGTEGKKIQGVSLLSIKKQLRSAGVDCRPPAKTDSNG